MKRTMKNKPLILDILNYKLAVIFDSELQKRGSDGECDVEGGQIRIGANLPARSFADVLLHELLHAIVGIGLDKENRLTELQINYISAVLSEVLRRNPGLKPILMP